MRGGVLNGSCYKLNFGALIKQSNSHKRAVLDYLRKVHFKGFAFTATVSCYSGRFSDCNLKSCEPKEMRFVHQSICVLVLRRA